MQFSLLHSAFFRVAPRVISFTPDIHACNTSCQEINIHTLGIPQYYVVYTNYHHTNYVENFLQMIRFMGFTRTLYFIPFPAFSTGFLHFPLRDPIRSMRNYEVSKWHKGFHTFPFRSLFSSFLCSFFLLCF